ncbi:MAG: lytic transglycosylase domain-containing protein [Myxococcota bacterium]
MFRPLAIPLVTACLLACASPGPAPMGPSADLEQDADALEPGAEPDPAPAEAAAPTHHSARDVAWLPAAVAEHAALIDRVSATHDVDPRLIAMIVVLESSGNPDAVSSMGARGLMQIMPATAAAIADAHALPKPTLDSLMDPETNVDLGVRHVADLVADLGDPALDDATVHRVATAYNGGIQVVLERKTPSEETQRYAENLEAMWRQRTAPKRH